MKSHIQYKKIKRGYITKLIKTKILRDDIPCNISECVLCEGNTKQLSLEKPILFLTADLLINQIDAIENFPIIDNCIIPQSEYNIIIQDRNNEKIFNRLNLILENRNIIIYPNEYNKDIADIKDENKLTQSDRNTLIFSKTIQYFDTHIQLLEQKNNIEHYFIILVSSSKNIKYELPQTEKIKCFDILSFAKEKMNESPDLFNYVAHFDQGKGKNDNDEMEIDGSIFNNHITESEMKTNIKMGKMFQGKIFFQPGIDNTAIVKCSIFDKDILIEGYSNLNRAMNGDIVCITLLEEDKWKKIQLSATLEENDNDDDNIKGEIEIEEKGNIINIQEKVKKSKKQPCGLVQGILRRNRTAFSGTIYNPNEKNKNLIRDDIEQYLSSIDSTDNSNPCVFIPIDSKYPNFLIHLYQKETYNDQRILVKFDIWNSHTPLPSAHFIKKLGQCLEIKVENDIILYEHNVDINPFSQKIIDSMPREDTEFKCPEDELEKRMDLRNRTICSIDPPGCKDIDDALHCRILDNGNYEVGVHIADVTHYVKPGSDVDKIAAKNCNTIYLVHKRTDMLPKVLTENLCSLVGGKERLAFSVLWEMDKDTLEIKHVEYGKSVIKSRAALTYEKANTIMNDQNDHSDLAEGIRNLNKIAKHLKQKRIEAGALILASNEMKFNLDNETNTINDICMYKTFETNSLVEEFMLLANVWVAKKIYEAYPSCAVLRRHPPPKEKELNNFVEILKERGYSIDTSSSLKMSESLDKIKKEKDPFFNKLVRSLLTRTMNQAKYFPSSEFSYEEFYHYGLAMEIYTHFTSPIRRYSDVLVHRLLAAALEIDYLPSDMSNKVKADRECTQMNRQNRVGFFCGKDSNYFSAFIFFKDHIEERKSVEIVIHSIDENFIKGISLKYGIEANLDFEKVGGKKEVDTIKKIVKLQNDDEIALFDHVMVEITPIVFNYRYEIKYYYIKKINI